MRLYASSIEQRIVPERGSVELPGVEHSKAVQYQREIFAR